MNSKTYQNLQSSCKFYHKSKNQLSKIYNKTQLWDLSLGQNMLRLKFTFCYNLTNQQTNMLEPIFATLKNHILGSSMNTKTYQN